MAAKGSKKQQPALTGDSGNTPIHDVVWPEQPRADQFPLHHRVIPFPTDISSGENPEVKKRLQDIGIGFLETGLEAFRNRVLPKESSTATSGNLRELGEPLATGTVETGPQSLGAGLSRNQKVILGIGIAVGAFVFLRAAKAH